MKNNKASTEPKSVLSQFKENQIPVLKGKDFQKTIRKLKY